MRIRDRGIGNIPFIMVLVVMLIALALYFMEADKSDGARMAQQKAEGQRDDFKDQVITLENLSGAMRRRIGIPGLDTAKSASEIETLFNQTLATLINDLSSSSRTKVKAGAYTVTDTIVEKGSAPDRTLVLYVPRVAPEEGTLVDVIKSVPASLKLGVDEVKKCIDMYNDQDTALLTRISELQTQLAESKSTYDADNARLQGRVDTEASLKGDAKDSVDRLTTQNEELTTKMSETRAKAEKEVALLRRRLRASEDALRNERKRTKLAEREDPEDGRVIAVSRGVVHINLGRRQKVHPGLRFSVWRVVQGNRRHDIGEVRVLSVDDNSCEARIIKLGNARIPMARGMSVSNPFYDPKAPLHVYIYGNLTRYPTSVARRRLERAGCKVVRTLEVGVQIIVLGEPPIEIEQVDDEEQAAAARAKHNLERTRRLNDVRDTAKSIGAIVVTEDVLSTFIDY